MKNKYDDILNELVYQIDDIVYDFYSKSNELIATKANQDRLIIFRDKAITTINDMNVRSLELISQMNSQSVIEERAARLIEKNEEIVSSSIAVIQSAAMKNEFIDDVQTLASNVYESAKDAYHKVEASGKLDQAKALGKQGVDKIQKSYEDFNNDPRVQHHKRVLTEKSKDLIEQSSEIIARGANLVSQKIKDGKEDMQEFHEDMEDRIDDIAQEAHDFNDDVVDKADEVAHTVQDNIDLLGEQTEEQLHDVIQQIEKNVEKEEDKKL